jgi:hypothetical protein
MKSKFRKRKFSKEFMQGVIHGDTEDTEVIEDEIVDHTRWSVVHNMIFSYEGKHYETSYSRGATEMQDEQPYEYDGDEIEVLEVEKVAIVKHEWRPVKNDS